MINIDDYKPFLIQKMGGIRPVYDSKEKWGMIVKSVPFNLLPDAKEPYKNDWKDENGDEEYVGELRFKAYTMNVSFAVIADGEEDANTQIRAFFDYIKSGEFRIYDTYTGIGRQHVRYAGYENKTFKRKTDKTVIVFEVKFKVNDPVTQLDEFPTSFSGVGILHNEGYIYSFDEWRTMGFLASDAKGVVIVNGTHNILLYKSQGYLLKWSSNQSDIVPGVTDADDINSAKNDFAGKANTDALIAAKSTISGFDCPAADWCRALGSEWYMPAAGEGVLLYDNGSEINACMSIIGGESLPVKMWYSTQRGAIAAWCSDTVLSLIASPKSFTNTVRAISALTPVVGIQHNNRKVYSYSQWVAEGFSASDARGVAIIDGIHTPICLHKQVTSLMWSSNTSNVVSGVTTTTNKETAKKDFAGKANTDAIIAAKSAISGFTCPAADWCRSLGAEWYLLAGGEMNLIMANIDIINECRTLIGCTEIYPSVETLTSTQYDKYYVWVNDSITSPELEHNLKSISKNVLAVSYL